MYSFTGPLIDGIEAVIRRTLAIKNFKHIPILEEIAAENHDYKIVVTVYNEVSRKSNEAGLNRLEKYLKILEPWKSKIVIIDDGSTDGTADAARKLGYEVIAFKENGQKIGSILRALDKIPEDNIFVCDLDTYPTDSSSLRDLAKMVHWMNSSGIGASCVNLFPHVRKIPAFNPKEGILTYLEEIGKRMIELYQFAEYAISMRSVRGSQATFGNESVMIISGGFGLYRKDLLVRTGTQFYNQVNDFSFEDLNSTQTAKNLGYRTGYFPHIIVETEVPDDLIGLWEQRRRWDEGTVKGAFFHLKSQLKDTGRRIEGVYNALGLVYKPIRTALAPFFFVYCVTNPAFGIGFYLTYIAEIALSLKANTTPEEFKEILPIIPLIPIYSMYQSLVLSTAAIIKHSPEMIGISIQRWKNNGKISYKVRETGLSLESTNLEKLENIFEDVVVQVKSKYILEEDIEVKNVEKEDISKVREYLEKFMYFPNIYDLNLKIVVAERGGETCSVIVQDSKQVRLFSYDYKEKEYEKLGSMLQDRFDSHNLIKKPKNLPDSNIVDEKKIDTLFDSIKRMPPLIKATGLACLIGIPAISLGYEKIASGLNWLYNILP